MTRLDPGDRLGTVAAVREALDGPGAPAVVAARARAPGPPRGLGGVVRRIVLFTVWLASTVFGGAVGVIEALLPRAYTRRRRRIAERHCHRPRRASAKLARLDARHEATMRALGTTRTNLRAIADKAEPYRRDRDERGVVRRQRPPRGRGRR